MSEQGEIPGSQTLKELLITSVHSPTKSISHNIKAIELDTLANECNRLMGLTYQDPDHQEKSACLYVLPNGKLVIDAKETTSHSVGSSMKAVHTVSITVYNNPLIPKHLRQDKYIAGIIHTHGLHNSPQSAPDLLPLFLGVDDPFCSLMSGVITPTRRIFVFRGENTPGWSNEFAQTKVDSWAAAFSKRVDDHTYEWMPYAEQLDINRRATTALLNQIASKYDLGIYSCASNSSTLKRGFL